MMKHRGLGDAEIAGDRHPLVVVAATPVNEAIARRFGAYCVVVTAIKPSPDHIANWPNSFGVTTSRWRTGELPPP
jgi:hypothetical protein